MRRYVMAYEVAVAAWLGAFWRLNLSEAEQAQHEAVLVGALGPIDGEDAGANAEAGA